MGRVALRLRHKSWVYAGANDVPNFRTCLPKTNVRSFIGMDLIRTDVNVGTTQSLTREIYPEYDALWHLITMGILDKDRCPKVTPKSKRPTRVAIIDTSVAVDHPNLVAAVNHDLAFDLFSSRLGAFPYLPSEEMLGELNLNVDTKVAEGLPAAALLLTELNDRLSHGSPTLSGGVQACVSAEFSNHGTAIAGLVGARLAWSTLLMNIPHPNKRNFRCHIAVWRRATQRLQTRWCAEEEQQREIFKL